MNIFPFDQDKSLCALSYCDNYVNKMRTEYCQLSSTAIYVWDKELHTKLREQGLCAPTHVNHPSAVWVRESSSNFTYLLELLELLNNNWLEKGKNGDAASLHISCFRDFVETIDYYAPPTELTPPPLAMPDMVRANYGAYNESKGYFEPHSWESCVSAYRAYMNLKVFATNQKTAKGTIKPVDKIGIFPTWRLNTVPEWYQRTYFLSNSLGGPKYTTHIPDYSHDLFFWDCQDMKRPYKVFIDGKYMSGLAYEETYKNMS
jgi:hypothetical protein